MRSAKAFVVAGLFCSTSWADGNLRGETQLGFKDNSVKVLSELSTAESMVKEELRGHPAILNEEMQLLHSAEDAFHSAKHAARKVVRGTQFTQQNTKAGLAGRLVGELSSAKQAVEQLLQGHPKELREEEAALNQAEEAAQHMGHPVVQAASLVETAAKQGKSVSKAKVSMAALEEQRSRSMATAIQEERSYATAEDKLAKEGSKVLSEFSEIRDAVAEAFAGKDSRAVKTAMEVGELMDGAQQKQQQVVNSNAAEAAKAKTDAAAHAAAFAQMTTQSKAAQEQQAYMSGMKKLVADGKNILSEFSQVKGAVAEAFAGKDSKAVEKAMEVGELLDQASRQQQQVTERDSKETKFATQLFGKLASSSRKAAFVEWQGRFSSRHA